MPRVMRLNGLIVILCTWAWTHTFQICLHEGPEIDPDQRDTVSTQDLKASLQDFLRAHCPGVDPDVAIEESCIYTMTPDQNPVIDSLPDRPNVVFGVGFSGMGFKLGPVTGRMLADLAQVSIIIVIVKSILVKFPRQPFSFRVGLKDSPLSASHSEGFRMPATVKVHYNKEILSLFRQYSCQHTLIFIALCYWVSNIM